jgi:hypothetical protein
MPNIPFPDATVPPNIGSVTTSFLSNTGNAVSDLFAASAATTQANLKSQGLVLQEEGIQLQAQGDLAEAANYDLAGTLALQNEQYTAVSTAIQQLALDRQISTTIGGQQAGTAGAGLAESGSALDLLADSASQGALAKNVLAQQGLITEAGYEEQQQSYETMSAAEKSAAAGEMNIAAQTGVLAQETVQAGQQAATGDYWSAAIKGVAAVANLFTLGGLGGGGGGGGGGGNFPSATAIY